MMQGRVSGRLAFRLSLILAVLIALAAGAVLVARGDTRECGVTGLFTSLPILWRESGDLAGLLASDAPPHWAQAVLAARGRLQPLDTLAGQSGKLPLPPDALLVMAQPRPLSPAENVALDDWVRAGGRVLLFADPMLTAQSAFALGDKRRPQDMVLLSPILTRWGLGLEFDEGQPAGMRTIALFGESMPVNLPGRFRRAGASRCSIAADGLVARCGIGRGEVLAIADAALFEDGLAAGDGRETMLARLLELLMNGN